MSAIDTATCTIQQTYQTNEDVGGLAVVATVAPDNEIRNQLWIAGTTALTIITEQAQPRVRIPIPGGPRFLCLPGGLTAYVTTRQGYVLAIDTGSYQVFAQLLTGGNFGPMDYDAITGQIYVPDGQHNRIEVLSPVHMGTLLTPRQPDRILPLNDMPHAVAITSDGQLGFIALRGGLVSMLNVPEHDIIHTFSVRGTPRFIITGLYPPPNDPLPRQTPSGFTVSSVASIVLLLVGLLALLGGLWLVVRRRIAFALLHKP